MRSTGEIGLFRLVSETGVAAGVRRIEAITGEAAYEKARADEEAIRRASELLKTSPDKMIERVEVLTADLKTMRAELDKARKKMAEGKSQLQAEKHDDLGVSILIPEPCETIDEAKAIADSAKKSQNPTLAYVTTTSGEAVVASSAPTLFDAGKILKEIAASQGGRGGGRPDFAQGKVPPMGADERKRLFIETVKRVKAA